MFDPVTSSLIATAPPLEGVDLNELPKEFTHAFADIVAARIRMRENLDTRLSSELVDSLLRMQRIAATHEALVALLPDRENRGAAAFVAAMAYQTYALGQSLTSPARTSSYVDGSSASADLCSTLLFMIAESYADAAEASKAISIDPERASANETALLMSIAHLAKGELRAISAMEVPEFDRTLPLESQAEQALVQELFRGVRNLAVQLQLHIDVGLEGGGVESGRAAFERVKALCVEPLDDIVEKAAVYSLFPGPLHLANLLLAVERDLTASAITRIPTPSGAQEAGWWQIIRQMSRQRPYLWKNHRDAIARGYLEQGISAAVSFPTGGGKSTLAELKSRQCSYGASKWCFLRLPTRWWIRQQMRSNARSKISMSSVIPTTISVLMKSSFSQK